MQKVFIGKVTIFVFCKLAYLLFSCIVTTKKHLVFLRVSGAVYISTLIFSPTAREPRCKKYFGFFYLMPSSKNPFVEG